MFRRNWWRRHLNSWWIPSFWIWKIKQFLGNKLKFIQQLSSKVKNILVYDKQRRTNDYAISKNKWDETYLKYRALEQEQLKLKTNREESWVFNAGKLWNEQETGRNKVWIFQVSLNGDSLNLYNYGCAHLKS